MSTPIMLHVPVDTSAHETLNGEPAWVLEPGKPLRIDADDWTTGEVLGATVLQQGPNHSRLDLRWFVKGEQEPRLVIHIGFLPGLPASLIYDLQYLDANTLFLPRSPGRLKATSLGQRISRDELSHAELQLEDLGTDQRMLITQPRLHRSTPDPLLPSTPLLDALGQLHTRDWKDKCTGLEELKTQEVEAPAISQGLQEPGSGWFRTHRDEQGRFALLSPQGERFFSAGIDCVNPGNSAYIIPGDEGLLPEGWEEDEILQRHSQRHPDHLSVNFGTANLERIFGRDWKQEWARLTSARLRDWGFNTIGNWSNPDYASNSGLPFVLPLKDYPDTDLQLFRDLPDVFDPVFEQRAQSYAEQMKPWVDHRNLIGYFMINEPKWGFGTFNLASEMLEDHPGSHTRKALAQWVAERYNGDASAWATAWGLEPGPFDRLERECFHRLASSNAQAETDLFAFSAEIVGRFVHIPAEALRAVDPHHLNLGMRWAWISSDLCFEAGKVADVFSLNYYGMEPAIEEAAEVAARCGIPTMIGEFHFGSLDRGLTGTGLRGVASQAERGTAYRRYVELCAADPNLVGCHYFQYNDQSAVGRFDGECWNIGLVDVCNRPYREMIEAARATHLRLPGLMSGELEPVSSQAVETGKVAF